MAAQDYYPYGEFIRQVNHSTGLDKYKFTGKERDAGETNLDYFGARYYNSTLGLWLSVDPLANKYPGWSPYNYTFGNPLRFIDPNGMGGDKDIWDMWGDYINSLKQILNLSGNKGNSNVQNDEEKKAEQEESNPGNSGTVKALKNAAQVKKTVVQAVAKTTLPSGTATAGIGGTVFILAGGVHVEANLGLQVSKDGINFVADARLTPMLGMGIAVLGGGQVSGSLSPSGSGQDGFSTGIVLHSEDGLGLWDVAGASADIAISRNNATGSNSGSIGVSSGAFAGGGVAGYAGVGTGYYIQYSKSVYKF